MKKQLTGLLIIALLASGVTSTIHAGTVSKTANGAWQLVKIGGGLILVTAGGGIATIPCCAALGCGVAGCLDKCLGFNAVAKEEGCCACCCATTGFVIGAPTIMCGGIMIKSGIKGLKKLLSHKKHKETIIIE